MHLEKLFKALIRKSEENRQTTDLSDLLPDDESREIDEQNDGSEPQRQNQGE